jgi:putative DNA primase/helicase
MCESGAILTVLIAGESRVTKKKISKPASGIIIKGEGRDEWGNRYFKLAVKGSDVNLPPFSMEQIGSDPNSLYKALSNAGVNIFTPKAKTAVLELLQAQQQQTSTFKVATRLGWNSGAIVRPDEIVGSPPRPLETDFGDLDRRMLAKYRSGGTLDEWKTNVGSICTGNSRLIFAVSLAFAGPILRFVRGPRGGGFQFWGEKETGKTTATMVAGSVWGCHTGAGNREIGFAETWHTTANQVEIAVLAHNDSLLILDETTQAGPDDRTRAQVVITVIMTLAQQREKERMTNVGAARSWRCYFLSTSNLTLDALAERGKVVLDDALRSRLTDIPLPTGGKGIYEDLHGFASGGDLTDTLVPRCRKYYGTAGRQFERRLVEDRKKSVKQLRKSLAGWRKEYISALKAQCQTQKFRPLQRSTGRCATVFAAGCLAITYDLVPWTEKELLRAVMSCQLDGLRHSQTQIDKADTSVADLRGKLVRYLADHRKEFRNLDKKMPRVDKHTFGSVPGYFASFKGKKWFYLTAEQLTHIIGGSGNGNQLKKELANDGLVATTPKGKYLVQRPIFVAKGNKGHKWVHAFRLNILQDRDKG